MSADLRSPLFFDAEHEKVAMFKMSQDVNEWDENVMEHFHEEYPELSGDNVEVVFKKTDPQRGYGYGYIGLGKEAEVQIPVIIKEYEMSPLDVMLNEGQAFPLTKESAKTLLHKTAMGKAIKAPKGPLSYVGPNISERIYPGVPWTGGQYKYASILSAVDLTQDQIDGFRQRLEDPSVISAWQGSDVKGILKIAAATQPVAKDEVKAGEGHPLVDAFIRRFDGEAEYGVIEKAGKYEVKGLSGTRYVGMVYPKVFDFYLRPQDVMLFADGRIIDEDYEKMKGDLRPDRCDYSAVQQTIVGKKSADVSDRINGCCACKGETGFFVVQRGNAAMAFTPLKIQSCATLDEDRKIHYRKDGQNVDINKRYIVRKYVATDSFGAVYRIVVSPSVKEVKVVNSMVMLPGDATWVSMGKVIKLSSKMEQTKKASYTGPSVTLRHLGGEGFSIEADWAEDWAKEGSLRPIMETYLSAFYTPETLPPLFDECQKVGKVNFNDRMEKTASVNRYEGAERIARDLTKEAASLSDAALADTVLSLQFINKDNVEKYIGFLPQLEKAASHLADMLIGSRLGMEVEEYPVKTAMENMVEVIEDLRLMKGK